MRRMDSRKRTTLKDTKGVAADGNDSLDSRRGRRRVALTSPHSSAGAEIAARLLVVPIFDTVRVQLEQLAVRPNEKRRVCQQFSVALPRASALDCAFLAGVQRLGHELKAACSEAVHKGELEGAARLGVGQR